MRLRISYIIIIVLFFSCKKDKLNYGKEILIGPWNWTSTQYTFGWCESSITYESITPTSGSGKIKLEFLEKGKMRFTENSQAPMKYRIVFDYFEKSSDNAYYFNSYLNNDTLLRMFGSIKGDSLEISRFPYIESDPNCENYLNFFVRE